MQRGVLFKQVRAIRLEQITKDINYENTHDVIISLHNTQQRLKVVTL